MEKDSGGFLRSSQRQREWSRGEYYSIIDVLDGQNEANQTLATIRNANIDFYQKSAPQLFTNLQKISRSNESVVELLSQASNHLSGISDKLDEIEVRLVDIRDTLDYGFELVASKLDVSNSRLSKITELLANPTRVQSEEFARRAVRSLENGWYAEALEDFERVVAIDQLNFASWYYIGLIRLEQLGEFDLAYKALSKCSKYSQPANKFYFGSAHHQMGLIRFLEDKIEEAIHHASNAFLSLGGSLASAFLLAELYAAKREQKDCLKYLRLCEAADPVYYLRYEDSRILNAYGPCQEFFLQRAAELFNFNKQTFREIRALANEALRADDSDIASTGKELQKAEIPLGDESGLDYLAQRVVHDKCLRALQNFRSKLELRLSGLHASLEKLDLASKSPSSSFSRDRTQYLQPMEETVHTGFSVLGGFLGAASAFVAYVWYMTNGFQITPLNLIATVGLGLFLVAPLLYVGWWLGFYLVNSTFVLVHRSREAQEDRLAQAEALERRHTAHQNAEEVHKRLTRYNEIFGNFKLRNYYEMAKYPR